ncbi:alcohol dehydrogenase [Methylocapsa sp. S129]|uniref:alcohol dehydrogenase n=1 Tax=Methylocapsa sp. S129 TaxID=1641869 RepID=UPI00131B4284|nr:alcohol dehydrogenase [Methylocapsa sp. S129]
MKSYQLVDFGAPLRETDLPNPQPSGHEVVLAVRAVGVCHSDLHLWDGEYDLGAGKRLMLRDRGIKLPLTMGHETAGEIVAIGVDVKDRKVGEVCLVYPWIGCGHCRVCRIGLENLCMNPRCVGIHCDGGYSDHLVVAHSKYLLPLDGLDPVAAAPFACSGVTTYSALKKLGSIIDEEPVLLIGAGGLGLMCLTILKAMGGKGAVVVDISADRRAAALKAGALAAVDASAADAAEQVAAALGGPCWGAIDLVGSPATASLAFNALAKGGKMVMVGLFGGAAPWPLPLIPMKAASIEGSYTGSLAELKELLDLVRKGAVPGIPIARRPMSAATETLEDLRQGRIVGRVVMTP